MPYEQTLEAAEDDTRAAYREAAGRAEREAAIGADDVDALARGFGGLKPALEYSVGMTRYFKADPIAAREKLYRDFASRPPPVDPEPESRATPPEDYTEQARIEFERLEDARQAMRDVPRDAERKRQLDESKELLAAAAAEFRTTPGQLLQQAAGVHQALEINPGHVATKVSRWHGAPINEQHAKRWSRRQAREQRTANLGHGLKQVEQAASFQASSIQDVKSAMAEVIGTTEWPAHRQPRTGPRQRLSYAVAEAAGDAARSSGRARKRHAEKARHARAIHRRIAVAAMSARPMSAAVQSKMTSRAMYARA